MVKMFVYHADDCLHLFYPWMVFSFLITLGISMGPRRVIEGQAAEVKRRERWEAAEKRRSSRRRNVGLLPANC